MITTLNDHHTFIFIGGRPIRNPPFVDDIGLIGDSKGEIQGLINRSTDRTRSMKWQSAQFERSKVMTNSTNDISADISM